MNDRNVTDDAASQEDRVERRRGEAPGVTAPCHAVYRGVPVAVRVPSWGNLRRRLRRRRLRQRVVIGGRGLGRFVVFVPVRCCMNRIVRGGVRSTVGPIVRALEIVGVLMIVRCDDRRVMRRAQVIMRHTVGQRRARSREAREQREDHSASARTEGTRVGHAPMYRASAGAIAAADVSQRPRAAVTHWPLTVGAARAAPSVIAADQRNGVTRRSRKCATVPGLTEADEEVKNMRIEEYADPGGGLCAEWIGRADDHRRRAQGGGG